jgi:hypothetical protein
MEVSMNNRGFVKKLVALLIAVALLPCVSFVSSATTLQAALEAQGEALLNQLIERQFEALITGEVVDTSDLFIESASTSQYDMFLEWRITEAVAMNTLLDGYTYDFDLTSVSTSNSSAEITAVVCSSYTLARNGLECGQNNYTYSVEVVSTLGGARISEIVSTEEMYSDFSMNILSVEKVDVDVSLAEAMFEDAIDDLQLLKLEMENIGHTFPVPDNGAFIDRITSGSNSAMALQSYSYSASVGGSEHGSV